MSTDFYMLSYSRYNIWTFGPFGMLQPILHITPDVGLQIQISGAVSTFSDWAEPIHELSSLHATPPDPWFAHMQLYRVDMGVVGQICLYLNLFTETPSVIKHTVRHFWWQDEKNRPPTKLALGHLTYTIGVADTYKARFWPLYGSKRILSHTQGLILILKATSALTAFSLMYDWQLKFN